MKIPIEPPFEGLWKHAYLVKNKEDRNMVCLVNDRIDRTTMALARYKMAVELGRLLTEQEQVDHIDNDKTNDAIENLQLLSPEDNRQKYLETIEHGVHGTNSMYRKGCRCEVCKKWKSEYMKKYLASKSNKSK